MGYDATPQSANLLEPHDVAKFCDKHDGNLHSMGDCEIEGQEGTLWVSATPTQTTRQNSVYYSTGSIHGGGALAVSGTNDADEVLLDPDHGDLTGHSSSVFATEAADYDVVVAVEEGNMMSTFGINK